jgi:REP element-mobilizing transposase RayT
MSHVFHQLYYHFTWGTLDRLPLIDLPLRPELLRIQAEEVANRGGIPVRHNALVDHIHLLVRLTPNILVSDFIGQVKGAVTYRYNREIKPRTQLRWQEGYGVLSVREGDVPLLINYIDRQDLLHEQRRLSRLLEMLHAT